MTSAVVARVGIWPRLRAHSLSAKKAGRSRSASGAMQSSIGLAIFLGYGLAHGLQLDGRAVAQLAATRQTGVAQPQGRRPSLISRRGAGCLMKLHDDGVLGVGVIGAGRIGMVHLEALSSCESAKAVIVSNPTVSKAQAAAARYKLGHFTCDFMEVINHPEVEAVWICSPSAFHAEQIKACAAAGKHVFCEKPIATGLKETI